MSTVFNNNHYLFTSESVGEGHPDKLCDQVSDAILDYCLKLDPHAHVACESFSTTNFLLNGGEIGFQTGTAEEKAANADLIKKNAETIARNVAIEIGYTSEAVGLDGYSCVYENHLHAQSSDINQGVVGDRKEKDLAAYEGQQGAGDQGLMFGFACSETPELMPATLAYSHKLLLKAQELRKSGQVKWMRPDSKSQVTIEYEGHKPVHIDAVVISHQHDAEVSYEEIKTTLLNEVIIPVLKPTGLFDEKTKIYINPTGRFEIGGPNGDAGLTGRKIIVDTYGGMGRHGGGAFSGKDPSKVDRSAAYMARYMAKNIVAAGIAERAEVQLAYAIGIPHPVSVMVDTFGTETVAMEKIQKIVNNSELFDCSPAGINRTLKLKNPIYRPTASYGHFGREPYVENGIEFFTWEKTDKVEAIKKLI